MLAHKSLVAAIFIVLTVVVIVIYMYRPPAPAACPTKLHQNADGTLTLHPSGREFADMNAFQQWFQSSGMVAQCPLPVMTGVREIDVLGGQGGWSSGGGGGWPNEQTYARTPINKVDDYEFSRIFGYEQRGEMVVPRQNFNQLLEAHQFDPTSVPISSDLRKVTYTGLQEGFTASGELTSVVAAANDFDPAMRELQKAAYADWAKREEDATPSAKERKAIQKIASKAFGNDPAFEPVVTQVGPNQWEVTELQPKRPATFAEEPVDEQVANTLDPRVQVDFAYRGNTGSNQWTSSSSSSSSWVKPTAPIMRPFGPSEDHKSWDYLYGPPI